MEQILKILKEKRGQYVSGEMLAQTSGITRAAIWKQLSRLRELGYVIESSPRKGYRLVKSTLTLLPLEIQDGLDTNCFGRVIVQQPEVDSTNKMAKLLAADGATEGTLVIAETQTNGRGRMGRNWASAPGQGLWFSLILRPKINIAALAGITLLAAVSVAKAINQVTGVQTQIKWPNDILYNDRKLVGILAELHGEPDLVNYLVLGIGVNVNQTVDDFSPELTGTAISLKMICERDCSRRLILQAILKEFEVAYDRLAKFGMSEQLDYVKLHSATLGKMVRISQGAGKVLEGQAIALESDGSLLLKGVDNNIIRIYSGDLIEKALPTIFQG
jgi:BirA family biotin operon repressor/biotin-[acetyl-CoA-carboxylase] ligase